MSRTSRCLMWLLFNVLLGLLQLPILYFLMWKCGRDMPWTKALENSVLLFFAVSLVANTYFQLHARGRLLSRDRWPKIISGLVLGVLLLITCASYSLDALQVEGMLRESVVVAQAKSIGVQIGCIVVATVYCLVMELVRP